MPDADGVLRMAAKNYHQAEANLEGAEIELRKLKEKLESCLILMKGISETEPVTWKPVKKIVQEERLISLDNMEMVSS